jgi:hypothetical protein
MILNKFFVFNLSTLITFQINNTMAAYKLLCCRQLAVDHLMPNSCRKRTHSSSARFLATIPPVRPNDKVICSDAKLLSSHRQLNANQRLLDSWQYRTVHRCFSGTTTSLAKDIAEDKSNDEPSLQRRQRLAKTLVGQHRPLAGGKERSAVETERFPGWTTAYRFPYITVLRQGKEARSYRYQTEKISLSN